MTLRPTRRARSTGLLWAVLRSIEGACGLRNHADSTYTSTHPPTWKQVAVARCKIVARYLSPDAGIIQKTYPLTASGYAAALTWARAQKRQFVTVGPKCEGGRLVHMVRCEGSATGGRRCTAIGGGSILGSSRRRKRQS